jgi:hypothetical protein
VDAKPDAEEGWHIAGAYGNSEEEFIKRIADVMNVLMFAFRTKGSFGVA